jgi:iodotyrosine deiodinase
MNFLNKILNRPINEKPFVLLVVGFPKKNCLIPTFAKKKKNLKNISSIF